MLAILTLSGVDCAPMNWRKNLSASIVSAILFCLAFPTVGWGLLIWVALLPALRILRESGWRRFAWGWFTGTLIQGLGYYWIFFTIRDFGGLNVVLSAGGALLFWAFQGLDMGLWLGVGPWLFRKWPPLAKAFGMAGFWMVIQGFLFPYVFPANYGAALAGLPLFGMGAALWSGKGMTFWILSFQLVWMVPAKMDWPRWPWALAIIAVALLGILVPRGQIATETLNIGVVQPNLIPWAKRGAQTSREIYFAHEDPTRKWIGQDLDMVLWPETAVPFDLRQSETFIQRLQHLSEELNAALVIGAVGVFGENDYTNEVWCFTPGGTEPQIYQKERLVLFSETLPWVLRWAKYFDPALGGFKPGQNNQVFQIGKRTMTPLVCFEALFPDLARKYPSQLFLNFTNDAWFGISKASALHLQHIRHRAVETGVPLVRATNSGISCWVDARGKLHGQTPVYQKADLIYQIPVPTSTPPNLAGWGERILWLWSLLAMVIAFLYRRSKLGTAGSEI